MNGTNVSSLSTAPNVSTAVLDRLAGEWDALSPEARKAARYVLDNPREVGVSTVREIAAAAAVKPNTVVRMARQVGFDGYDDFREPFRDAIRAGVDGFPDRARRLQSARKRGAMGTLHAEFVACALRNIEDTFAATDERALKAAAKAIWRARQVFTLGVGVNNANARNFTYLASTGMSRFHAIPRAGSTVVDDLALAGKQDVLLAITCQPYRSEVVEGVELAREQGVTVIGLSDSRASPLIIGADHGFVVAADAPQFFPSSVGTVALLETLLSYVIAEATPDVVRRVDRFHARRHALGIYVEDS